LPISVSGRRGDESKLNISWAAAFLAARMAEGWKFRIAPIAVMRFSFTVEEYLDNPDAVGDAAAAAQHAFNRRLGRHAVN
jgi:hypothetical protein